MISRNFACASCALVLSFSFFSKAGPVNAFAAGSVPRAVKREPSPLPARSRQLLLVRTPSWSSADGVLQRYERSAPESDWRAVGESLAINVGRKGMAWGIGLHEVPDSATQKTQKKEGDGRSPAGVFLLGTAFGYAPELPNTEQDYPYQQLTKNTVCIEDTESEFYNRIVDASAAPKSRWERRSYMRRADGLFKLGVVIQQNAPKTVPGAGSCVFLHIWRSAKQGTSGCTSMSADNLGKTLNWLDPASIPALVALPEPEYELQRANWRLP